MDWVASDPYISKLRILQEYAGQRIRKLLSAENIDTLDVETFEREVWHRGEVRTAADEEVPEAEWRELAPEEIGKRLESGEWHTIGNMTLDSGVPSWGTRLNVPEDEKPVVLRRALEELLHSTRNLHGNFRRAYSMTNGLGKHLSLVLALLYPDEFGVVSPSAEEGFNKLANLLRMQDDWNDGISLRHYEKANSRLKQLRDNSGGVLNDMLEVAWFLFKVSEINEPRYWKVSLGIGASDSEQLFVRAVSEGFVALRPGKPDSNFAHFQQIAPGDYIAIHREGAIVGVGRAVRSDYRVEAAFDDLAESWPHRLDVEWIQGNVASSDFLNKNQQFRSVIELSEGLFWLVADQFSSSEGFHKALNPPENWRALIQLVEQGLCSVLKRSLSRASCKEEAQGLFRVVGPAGEATVRERHCRRMDDHATWTWRFGEANLDEADFHALHAVAADSDYPEFWLIMPSGLIRDHFDRFYELQGGGRQIDISVSNGRLHAAAVSGIEDIERYENAFGLIGEAIGAGSEGADAAPAIQSVAATCCCSEAFVQDIIDQLRDKKQVIFYGPPGTGKTYIAQEIARYLSQGDKSRVKLIQFHPSYTYEDFMEGIKPQSEQCEDGRYEVTYPVVDGAFKRFCDEARDRPDEEHVFIIDEINRGQIAKIFGELMYLLEYRDRDIELAYTRAENDGRASFSIPANVLIIGTMNTADRSIALVDFALRRRFTFYPFYPDEGDVQQILPTWLEQNAPGMAWVTSFVRALNELLRGHLDRDLLVGHSYFMHKQLDEDRLRSIWRLQIEPLLHEYFVGKASRLEAYSFEGLVAEAKGTVEEEEIREESEDAASE
jgi:MoxR-like ATPase